MTKLAYFECPTGIAGDMCLGALLDLGVPLSLLQDYFRRLDIEQEFELQVSSVHRQSQQATYVRVELGAEPGPSGEHQHSHHRHLPEIERLILGAGLPKQVEIWSLDIFRNLALAEGKVHGIEPNRVHFHEVGATDAIVDIVGTCIGLHWLGVEEIFCSALPTGGGTVKAAHGKLSVPVPAVLQLWQTRQVPVYDNGIHKELVTPTGAAIATTLAQTFGPPPPLSLHQIGLGAGTLDLSLPNILRIWLGESAASPASATHPETVAVLETQIDDLNPQVFGYVFDALFQAGALDVFTQAVGMKKSRPGILLTVICPPETVSACETVIFKETSTLGIRRSQQQRTALQRAIKTIDTTYGPVQIKLAYHDHQLVNVQPEYEDCAQIAQTHHLSWQRVHQAALVAWYQQSEIIGAK
ncbi:nickel pincer cofactor biosynthesis protein LarC [Acaryochloris sp. CCMEE 5410]|uniref:nickel pincer cofactor biosynthesis protein LarC n=1 Tax=Acaryochloris sp. CCMEE 5410 TaxID=310037 RepID=UPI0002484B9E|nr:nickel pincer cofactor biosynthesis protein LarC [Acaryochloris sp. CCMEE 5410]KAI9132953.1 nickel pincer cofactor biosynthesis protein LarC [Acaryochloris sp. CCMEE 5410]